MCTTIFNQMHALHFWQQKSNHPSPSLSLTKANNSQRLSTNTSGTSCHLPNLLHAWGPSSLSEGLVHPGDSPVEVEDET